MTAADAYRLALRRIEVAERTNAEILDLGDLPLIQLPHEISRLMGLRVLALGTTSPAMISGEIAWETVFERTPNFLEDLTPLAGLANFRQLGLSHTSVSDLTALSGLTGLEALNLTGTRVRNTSPFPGRTRDVERTIKDACEAPCNVIANGNLDVFS